MENHPIPQDVTGFQFKLIGNMTIKQFAYIAVGAIIAFVFFYAPINPFIRFPLGVFCGLFGIAMAFLPVEGRPADAMLSYFIKALVTPNQYAYHKVGGVIGIFTMLQPAHAASPTNTNKPVANRDTDKATQLKAYLNTTQNHTPSPLDKKEELFLAHILTPQAQTGGASSSQPSLAPQPTPPSAPFQPTKADAPLSPKEIEEQEANLSLQAATLKHELDGAKEQEAKEKDAAKATSAHQQVTSLEQKLQELLAQKEQIEKELLTLKGAAQPAAPVVTPLPIPQPQQAPTVQTPPAQPVVQTVPPPQSSVQPTPASAQPLPTQGATVHKIPADMARSIGLPHMPEVPNLIVGIVKDPRGNILQNILVEVKDKDGTPARAFRTNSLGQFASATPLSNGSYTIEFEDPKGQHRFDAVALKAQGEIMLPLEIISHDEREALRKELFN